MVRDLESLVAVLCRPGKPSGEPGGGLKEVMDHLHALRDLSAYERCTKDEGLDVKTLTLVPGMMSLPEKAAQIPMAVPHVPKIVEDILKEPLVFDRPPEERPAGRVNMYMQVSSWRGVANALAESGLMQLIPEELCRVPERAGAFGVPKKPGDPARVIIDRRPRNAVSGV
eukprot:6491750-Amphidinium_carterae.4